MAESRPTYPAPPASERCAVSHRPRRRAVGEVPRVHRRRRPEASAADLVSLARERAVQSRRAQGLADHITDPATLDQVAQLVLADRPPAWVARPPP
jgi:hypothetical protein